MRDASRQGISIVLRLRGEHIAQFLLRLGREIRLNDLARQIALLQGGDHTIGRRIANQENERHLAGTDLVGHRLGELVIDANVSQLAGERSGGGADRYAGDRHEKDQSKESAPERTAECAYAGEALGLVELDLIPL